MGDSGATEGTKPEEPPGTAGDVQAPETVTPETIFDPPFTSTARKDEDDTGQEPGEQTILFRPVWVTPARAALWRKKKKKRKENKHKEKKPKKQNQMHSLLVGFKVPIGAKKKDTILSPGKLTPPERINPFVFKCPKDGLYLAELSSAARMRPGFFIGDTGQEDMGDGELPVSDPGQFNPGFLSEASDDKKGSKVTFHLGN